MQGISEFASASLRDRVAPRNDNPPTALVVTTNFIILGKICTCEVPGKFCDVKFLFGKSVDP